VVREEDMRVHNHVIAFAENYTADGTLGLASEAKRHI
jgi:hypothetical protein